MRTFIFTLLIGICNFGFSQAEVKINGPEITMVKEVHDYGTIKQHADGSSYFGVVNTGNEPLIITKTKGSCGCTVPQLSKEPIAPGDTVQMKVTYATDRIGKFEKNVTITSNATNSPVKRVKIKGVVLKPAGEAKSTVKPKVSAPIAE